MTICLANWKQVIGSRGKPCSRLSSEQRFYYSEVIRNVEGTPSGAQYKGLYEASLLLDSKCYSIDNASHVLQIHC